MKWTLRRSVKVYRIIFWIMIGCFFICTIGQFMPVYFTFPDFRFPFYITIFSLMVITVCISSYRTMYLPHKNNWIYSSLISLISTGLIFILFGFFYPR